LQHDATIARTATLAVTEWLFKQFKEFTNEKYKFGDDWLADWWIEKVGYLRTDEGIESLRQSTTAGADPK
jgi:hypothetical protein